MNDLITIIIPVYNTKKYLDECINSVLEQTYGNLEILVIDDGSTDGTGEQCDKYISLDNRVRVFHKANEGLGLTRNYGINHATGEYISFLDSDDRIASDFIEILYKITIRENADVCKAGFTRFRNNEYNKKVQYKDIVYRDNQVKNDFLPRLIGSSPTHRDSVEMSVWGALYKTRIIKDNGIVFPSERELISEDIIFNIHYFQYAKIGCLSSSTGYFYRVNDASLTKLYRKDRFEAYKKFYEYTYNLLNSFGYKGETTNRLGRYFFICLRKCVQQEASNSEKKSIKGNLEKICSDELVKKIIEEYPCEKLEFKQRTFLYLIKKKKVMLLKLILKTKIL